MKTVLIVDDEVILREYLREIFESKGVKVVEAANGAEALSYLDSHGVDAILSDIDMPLKNGVDLLKDLRSNNDHTPFIFMSGGSSFTESQLLSYGAVQFLRKPHLTIEKILEILGY